MAVILDASLGDAIFIVFVSNFIESSHLHFPKLKIAIRQSYES